MSRLWDGKPCPIHGLDTFCGFECYGLQAMTDREIYQKCKEYGLEVSIHDHNLQTIGRLLQRIETLENEAKESARQAGKFADAVITGDVSFRRVEDPTTIRVVTGTCYVGAPTHIYYRARNRWGVDVEEAYIIIGDEEEIPMPETNQFKNGYAFGVG